METLATKAFRFIIFDRFMFLWKQLVAKTGSDAAAFIDLARLTAQFSSWEFEMSGDLQYAFQNALLYCRGSKTGDLGYILNPLLKCMYETNEKSAELFALIQGKTVTEHLAHCLKEFHNLSTNRPSIFAPTGIMQTQEEKQPGLSCFALFCCVLCFVCLLYFLKYVLFLGMCVQIL